MSKARFVVAVDAMDRWRDDLLTGKPPVFYPLAERGPLSRIEVGPKLITLVGGAPGTGKTAFVMQCVLDALRLSPQLRAVVCNVEMPADVLLDRQLARLSGVPLDAIRHRRLAEVHATRIDAGLATLDTVADRLAFVRPGFDLANVAATADDFAPLSGDGELLLVLDYVQRIAPPGGNADRRGAMDESMNFIRQFADAGAAVLVVSAVGRQKDKRGGSTYAGDAMNLASFKESGELEFGADDAFILVSANDNAGGRVLRHLKARHREPADVFLRFDGARQRFDAVEAAAFTGGARERGGWSAAIAEREPWDDDGELDATGGQPWQP